MFYLVNYIDPNAVFATSNFEKGWAVNDDDDRKAQTQKKEIIARINNTENKNNLLQPNTRKQYFVALEKYKNWCAKEYEHDKRTKYEVNSDKILRFFEEVVYTQQVVKYFNRNKSLVRAPLGNGQVTKTTVGIEAIKQTKNTVVNLGREQASRVFKPNPGGILPRDLLKNGMQNHTKNTQYQGSVGSSKDRGLGDPISDSYSKYEHLLALKATWTQRDTMNSSYIREHFSLAVRHSMLLRDEDLRRLNLNLADMFMYQLTRGSGEVQQLSMLMFSMRTGKTNQNHRQEYGCAIRHSDVRRCSIGALAFYLFDRFQNKNEVPIDFQDPKWQTIKVLIAAGKERTSEIKSTATHEVTTNVFASVGIDTSYVTHSGRHSESIEAQRLGIPDEEIRRAGRWVQGTSKMTQYYLSNLPVPFARGIAGFKDRPFHLRRNEVTPSKNLQRMIFPFIEDEYRESEEEHELWLDVCTEEMDDISKDEDVGEDENDRPKEFDVTIVPKRTVKKNNDANPVSRSDFAKRRLLKLLLRLRRVVFQDAAALMHKGWNSPVFNNDIFQSDEFLLFKDQVVEALKRKETLIPDNIPPSVNRALQGVIRQNDSIQNEIKGLRELLMMSMDALKQSPLPILQAPYHTAVSYTLIGQDRRHNSQLEEPSASIRQPSQSFKIHAFDKHTDAKTLLVQIWGMYQSYLDYIKRYRKDTIESRLRKRVTSGGRIICWFLVQGKTIMDERHDLSLNSAILLAADSFQNQEGNMIWTFDSLYKTSCEKLQSWEKQQETGFDVKKAHRLEDSVKENDLTI